MTPPSPEATDGQSNDQSQPEADLSPRLMSLGFTPMAENPNDQITPEPEAPEESILETTSPSN